MTNEQEVVRSVFSSYINDLKAHSTKPDRPMFKMLEDVKDKAIKALEAQPTDLTAEEKEIIDAIHNCHCGAEMSGGTEDEVGHD